MHLVDQEQGARLRALGHLPDLPQQVGQILFGIARVGHAGGGLDVQLDLEAGGDGQAERLDHPEGPLHPVPDPVLAAHLPQQPRRHAGEGDPEVGLGSDLGHVGGGPPGLAGQDVELHEQDGFSHPPQTRVDEAALVVAGGQALDEGLEVLQVLVPAGQGGRLAARPWGVGVVPLVHPRDSDSF